MLADFDFRYGIQSQIARDCELGTTTVHYVFTGDRSVMKGSTASELEKGTGIKAARWMFDDDETLAKRINKVYPKGALKHAA